MAFLVEQAGAVEDGLGIEERLMIRCGLLLMVVGRTTISLVTIIEKYC